MNPRELVLHVAFQVLVDFVEVDCAHATQYGDGRARCRCACDGLDYLDWSIQTQGIPPYQKKCAIEAKELYVWWRSVFPNRVPWWESDDPEMESKQFQEEQEMLKRLIAIRDDLWT